MERYMLMNKDKAIAELKSSLNHVSIARVISMMPPYLGDIDSWVSRRFELFGRNNIIKMAKLAGISTNYEYLTITKAISLTDTFWVNDLLNQTTWEKVNPYTNRLSRIMAEIAIEGINVYNNQYLKLPSPQYRIDGQTDKCIKRVNGKLILYKTDGEKWSDLAGCRPYAEYFASALYRYLGLPYCVKYNIVENVATTGKIKPYCTCELFTSQKNGFVQIANTSYEKEDLDTLCKRMNNSQRLQFKTMALMDSIILNIDRHQGNYGFLYDNDTFRIKSLAPIYDNDCSLGSTISIQDKSFDEAYNEIVRSHLTKLEEWNYDEQALWGMTNEMYKVLKSVGKVELKKPSNIRGLSDRRVAFMNYIINRRIKEILSLI